MEVREGRLVYVSALLLLCLLSSINAIKPNIIFILTDDQDATANSLDYMPRLNKIMREGGTEFTQFYVSTGLCCPSRATILRGQYCHNTEIWDNGGMNNDTFLSGGFEKFRKLKLENSTVATLFQNGGYETMLCGKYINGYKDNHAHHVPKGWDHWQGMTDLSYFGPHVSVDGNLVNTSNSTYQTDYIRDQALEFLTKKRNKNKPFFLYLSPHAPHAPSLPAPRHANLFNNMTAPKNPSYNPDDDVQQQKPSWLKILPKLDQNQMDRLDEFYRNRLRAMLAVDEMLQNITDTLEKEEILDNTYIFYASDNGQHLGDYRLSAGKRQAYDTDVRVPFLVRGPGVMAGVKNNQLLQNVDFLPTWVELAGIKGPEDVKQQDGKSMVPLLTGDNSDEEFRTAAIIEMYGGSSGMNAQMYGKFKDFEGSRFWNNTYVAIRVTGSIPQLYSGSNYLFALWCTGEMELYNVTTDPYELKNTVGQLTTQEVMGLQELVVTLSKCVGSECYDMKQILNNVIINLEYRMNIGSSSSAQIPCHNPSDFPPDYSMDNLLRYIDDARYCYEDIEKCEKELFRYGLPFADEDIIPEHVLVAWKSHENRRQ
ncbi:N-acetylglucosamine-6-sulfatase-like [Dysidea avara]|uniref:N-acetylglucosamine-6-sulfatase-like n=1 Tax=Dysidea avara TaxID=196820 RepID=UPI00332BC451